MPQPSHRDGDAQRKIHALLPSEEGAKAFAILVDDLELLRPQRSRWGLSEARASGLASW
jgi:hypothetical protein